MSLRGFQSGVKAGKFVGNNRWMPAMLLVCSGLTMIVAVTSAPASPVPWPQAKKWADQMPDGDAKKIITSKCQLCHTLERVVTSHRTKDDWASVVNLMVEQGAALNDDETKTVIDYLAANYPPKDAAAPAAGGSGAAPGAASTTVVDPDQAQFSAPPDSLGMPKGITMAVVSGDPAKPGLFSVLLKLPADLMVPAHWQSTDLDFVVLRGTYQVGNGDAVDASKLQGINSGQVVHVPAQSHEFGQAKGATVLLLYGIGPLSISWGQ